MFWGDKHLNSLGFEFRLCLGIFACGNLHITLGFMQVESALFSVLFVGVD